MGRLIDADKLLEETRRDRDYAEKNGFMDMYHERQALIERIEAQPTAYDVDKVVEQLESYPELEVTQYPLHGKYLKKDSVLRILKGGGVDE